MENKQTTFKSIDEYIATFPEDVQTRLKDLKATIQRAAPDAEEKFSYGMPTEKPIVGDWNGDGIDTPGVVRASTW